MTQQPSAGEPSSDQPQSRGRESNRHPSKGLSGEELERLIENLEAIVDDRGLLLGLTQEQQERFLKAAGHVAHPGRGAKRKLVQAARQQRRREERERKQRDEDRLELTGIRQSQSIRARRLSSAAPTPEAQAQEERLQPLVTPDASHFTGELESDRNCYICKENFRRLHFFYDSMCPSCAEFNWFKRNQVADLSGRYALLTGGRVKIGFEAALRLLRCGAHVVVTTRFPVDAANRFAAQEDSPKWLDRLQVYGLDMRHTPSVEALADHLCRSLPRLDFILNNACQTVRRPPGYYEHLIASEQALIGELPETIAPVLSGHVSLLRSSTISGASVDNAVVHGSEGLALTDALSTAVIGVERAAELSQLALLPEDRHTSDEAAALFPVGQYDRELQQVDLREKNSWRLKLAEVSTVEMLEVHLVNSVAPFILNARLKPAMLRVPSQDKHIVNVSAMEGVFYRAFKRDTHPHTNMAKAALNMMTRTSAADYIQDGIHMNSVDTGWITDEDPIEITHRKKAERGFSTPLDTIDAAARICDPIIDGITTGNHVWGKFLKDYKISNW